jgi:hypothetical protein
MKSYPLPQVRLGLLCGAMGTLLTAGCSNVADLAGSANSSKYNQLQEGMTSAQAKSVMGSSYEESFNGSRTTTYTWKSADGSRVSASFQDDRLVGKSRGGYTGRRRDRERLRRLLP